ncbi:MAG: hypothetical protein QOH35_4348 [Acidobacteriaceae bacterium]|jgi:hypothetical protein|nr:hypothetical protein [Acidobacteriaceae bacterium]MDX6461979.1 hypothetical protein [Acidobacteriaceae bacterium]MEA2262944.1 hypothetical protein [Acidobacteriaceae bacterium]MEA2542982.1 hypothetical protein [Acidobacteriaceae bacterium]
MVVEHVEKPSPNWPLHRSAEMPFFTQNPRLALFSAFHVVRK